MKGENPADGLIKRFFLKISGFNSSATEREKKNSKQIKKQNKKSEHPPDEPGTFPPGHRPGVLLLGFFLGFHSTIVVLSVQEPEEVHT